MCFWRSGLLLGLNIKLFFKIYIFFEAVGLNKLINSKAFKKTKLGFVRILTKIHHSINQIYVREF